MISFLGKGSCQGVVQRQEGRRAETAASEDVENVQRWRAGRTGGGDRWKTIDEWKHGAIDSEVGG